MRGSSMSTGKQGRISKRTVLWNLLMFLLMMGGAVLVPYLRDSGQAVTPLYLILAGVLAFGAVLYSFVFEPRVADGFLF